MISPFLTVDTSWQATSPAPSENDAKHSASIRSWDKFQVVWNTHKLTSVLKACTLILSGAGIFAIGLVAGGIISAPGLIGFLPSLLLGPTVGLPLVGLGLGISSAGFILLWHALFNHPRRELDCPAPESSLGSETCWDDLRDELAQTRSGENDELPREPDSPVSQEIDVPDLIDDNSTN